MNTRNVSWIDYSMFFREAREDSKDFSFVDFMLWGSPDFLKLWWWLIIPGLNFIYAIAFVIAIITIPVRVIILIVHRKKMKKYAYDIEQTTLKYKLIQSKSSKLGLCYFSDFFFDLWNRILIKPEYTDIIRETDVIYLLQDSRNKWGLYHAGKSKFIFHCEYDSITFESEDLIILNKDMTQYKTNIYGERVMR